MPDTITVTVDVRTWLLTAALPLILGLIMVRAEGAARRMARAICRMAVTVR